jgi:hypothetical protein
MGNSEKSRKEKNSVSQKKAASSQDQEATKEDTWSSNPSVEEDDRTQSCYKKGGTFESEFWQQKTFDT